MTSDFWLADCGRVESAASEVGNCTCPGSFPLMDVIGAAGAAVAITARTASRQTAGAIKPFKIRMIRSPISLKLQLLWAPATRLADDSPVPAEVIGARQSALK